MITILSTQSLMMWNKVILSLLFLLLISCKSEPTAVHEEVSLFKEEIPQDFLSFYDRFHSDAEYQLSHIIFPLKQKTDSTLWYKEDWVLHKPFNTQGGEFSRKYTHLNGIVVENIQDQKGLYTIERRFSKSSDGYNLIFYKTKSAFENSDFKKVSPEDEDQ